MILKKAISYATILTFTVVGIMGCDDSSTEAISEPEAAIPGYCEEYCTQSQNCSSEYRTQVKESDNFTISINPGEYEDDLLELELDDCIVQCAWMAERTTYIAKEECSFDAQLSYQECENTITNEISGEVLSKFDQCIWTSGTPSCEKVVNSDDYRFQVIDLEDSGQCEEIELCFELVKDYIPTIVEWRESNSACLINYEGMYVDEQGWVLIDFDTFFI